MPLKENISSFSARRDSAEDISSFPASRDSAEDISSFPASRDSAKNISSFSARRDSAKNISSFPASRDSAKVPCLAPIKHNKQRRKKDHDYTAISLYLITVTTTNRQRLLGTLLGNSAEAATIEATDIGKMVIACFKRIPKITKQKTGCRVQVVQYQLMPDHFHGILYVQDELPKEWPLGQIISGWKGACTRAYNALISSSPASRDSAKKTPLFNPGYNDRILNQYGQLEGWIQYLRDNPRRLWLKIHFPDRLRKIYEFTAGKQGHRYTAVGDTFLVKYPERIQVRCHRNLSKEEIQKEVDFYLSLARKGVVLVSPFISPAERAVYEACYREKLKMIRIVNRGMDNQFVYPSGRDLQGCSDGFMLILAPYVENSNETRAARISRATCLDMNGYAADLSTFTLSREAENELKKESAPE